MLYHIFLLSELRKDKRGEGDNFMFLLVVISDPKVGRAQ
jgi:hypothetical protein